MQFYLCLRIRARGSDKTELVNCAKKNVCLISWLLVPDNWAFSEITELLGIGFDWWPICVWKYVYCLHIDYPIVPNLKLAVPVDDPRLLQEKRWILIGIVRNHTLSWKCSSFTDSLAQMSQMSRLLVYHNELNMVKQITICVIYYCSNCAVYATVSMIYVPKENPLVCY